jgi:hypothetical protein
MSWNNVLPYWYYSLVHEHDLASMSCAFEEEWFSGTSRVLPDGLIAKSKATFKTWDEGEWNYEMQKEFG